MFEKVFQLPQQSLEARLPVVNVSPTCFFNRKKIFLSGLYPSKLFFFWEGGETTLIDNVIYGTYRTMGRIQQKWLKNGDVLLDGTAVGGDVGIVGP